jgi:hypothetical protein
MYIIDRREQRVFSLYRPYIVVNSCFSGTREFITVFPKHSTLDPILTHFNPIHLPIWRLPQAFPNLPTRSTCLDNFECLINRAIIQLFSQVLIIHFNVNPSIYTWVSKVFSFLQIFRQKLCMHFTSLQVEMHVPSIGEA